MSSGTGGRTPSTNSNQLGNTQPASAREATHSRTTFMLAISPPPLSPCNMMRASSAPWANNQPNLPNERLHEIVLRCAIPIRLCSGATTWWHSVRMSPLAPQEADSDTHERHGYAPLRTEESDLAGPFTSAMEQEEPSRLYVTHQRYSFQKRLVFRHLAHQLRLDELIMPHWRSQHDDTLLHDWQTMVSSPHDCIWVQSPGW